MRGETIHQETRVKFRVFQSTPLMRGETWDVYIQLQAQGISIHSPHARGDADAKGHVLRLSISIHSPHARGDFQKCNDGGTDHISIHSPHARGDVPGMVRSCGMYKNFNPLPSCEGRLNGNISQCTISIISIHSPHARGDSAAFPKQEHRKISIHSPHARGDVTANNPWVSNLISIHSPHARGDHFHALHLFQYRISIHSPHARGDMCR